jgi:hypothetical protein
MATDLKKAFSKKFLELKPNITGPDKLEAAETLNISRPTIDKYLNGIVVKLDIAESLYTFFSAKVNQRKDLIAA